MERTFVTHKVRKTIDLGGVWEFWVKENPDKIQNVIIPSCLETYPGYENYRGQAVFTKKINAEGNLRFCFQGVSHTALVFFDDELIASHYNAYTPFEAVISEVSKGIHSLRVEIDNSFHEYSSLHIPNDYYSYGGITRPVVMEVLEEVYIQRIQIVPQKKNEKWQIQVKLKVNRSSTQKACLKNYELKLYLNEECFASIPVTVTDEGSCISENFEFAEVLDYQLSQPELYYLSASLFDEGKPIDDLIERFGFREVRTDESGIYMNGQLIKVKGFNRHEDHGQFGCAIPVEAMAYDISLMKDMGANAVRTCHYPNDQRFLDLCDELGILVWEESHARGLSEERMRHEKFREQSLTCIEEMIVNHINHPSIFIWGILNECASHTEYGRGIYEEQYALIRKLDDSRPVTSASCQMYHDICLDMPDVVSLNIYPGWYLDISTKQYLKDIHAWIQKIECDKKAFIISEVGAGAIYGCHSSAKPKWSEERQCDILREQITAILETEYIAGIFLWQFCDCRVTEDWFAARPRTMNNKGVVDEFRRKKLAYEVVKELFMNL